MGDIVRFNSPDVQNHYHPKSNIAGTLAKLAIAAGLLGLGGGAGVGIPLLVRAMKAKPASPPVVMPGEIRDWKISQPTVE